VHGRGVPEHVFRGDALRSDAVRPPWAALCEAVAKLRVEVREEAAVIPLRAAARGDGVETESANGGA
jgi:hypothetical protein